MEQFYNLLLTSGFSIVIKIVLTIALTLLGLWMVKLINRRALAHIHTTYTEDGRRARLITLVGALRYTLRVVILVLATLSLLATLGINITPLLTSLGIAGLALSLGAQTLIKDYIGGLLVLTENLYIVGELVTLTAGNGTATGTVEKITMRATWIRDVNGQIHVIPNGEVRFLSNASRDWSLAVVNLNLDFNTDIRKVSELLEENIQQLASDPEISASLLDRPQVQGWSNLSEFAVQVRLSAKVRPGSRVACESLMRRYALETLSRAGISPSVPVQELRLQQSSAD